MAIRYFKIEGIIEIDEETVSNEKNLDLLDVATSIVVDGAEKINAFFGGGIVEVDEEGEVLKTK